MKTLYTSKPMRILPNIFDFIAQRSAKLQRAAGVTVHSSRPAQSLAKASAYGESTAATATQSSAKLQRAAGRFRPRAWLLGAVALLIGTSGAFAQQQFAGWCARVKIEIEQELTLERIGFEATLTVTNNDGEDAITDFLAELTFGDPDEPGVDVSDRFFVRPPQIQAVSSVDGNGVIQPTRTAVVRWFIIPKIAAGGEDPRGKVYNIGCRLGGRLGGVEIPQENMLVIPASITVRPEPQLEITYFLPRDVQANNPFTETVEAPIPFTLGVLVRNSGFGTARDLQIDSQQPKIVENRQGLLLVAQLLGARVMDSPLHRASLLVDLGDIEPGQTRKGAWDMITTLSGEFIDFNASYTHASDLGGEETSVIVSLEAHFFAREVLNDQPGRDDILDFLAITDRNPALIPDALYESEGNILPVNHLANAEVLTELGDDLTITVGVLSDFEGWCYMRLTDPAQGRYGIEKVTRSDGKVLHPRNVWTSLRYDEITNARLDRLHIFDLVEPGVYYEYEIIYETPVEDTTPPVTEILFAGDFTRVGGTVYVTRDTQMYFLAEDESPVSILYKINDEEEFRPGLPFQLSEPGNYTITFFSRDAAGNEEEPNTILIVLSDAPPGFDVFPSGDLQFVHAGDTLSVRPAEADLGFTIGASPFPVTGTVEIFPGVAAWPQVTGVPLSPTSANNANITVSGIHVDYYQFRLNNGSWSSERPVDEPLLFDALSGNVTVDIRARSRHGPYPQSNDDPRVLNLAWTVQVGVPAFALNGFPPLPVRESAAEFMVSAPNLELYRWRLDDSFFVPEAPPSAPVIIDHFPTGERFLELVGRLEGGNWQPSDNASRLSFLADPLYGSEPLHPEAVRTIALGALAGPGVEVIWDGLDDNARPVPAGWYTVRVTLEDDLGRASYRSRLIEVRNIAGSPAIAATATTGPDRPNARGDWVVWQDRADGPWQVRARNLATGGSVVTPSAGSRDQTFPRTDGRFVVWQARNSSGSWDIWAYNLESGGAPLRLTNRPLIQNIRPVVDAPWVVWRERSVADSEAPWQLVAHNLVTSETFPVNPGPADQLEANLQSGRLVWRDTRDVGVGEIYFAHLDTGERRRLTNRIDGQFHPSIFGHWVAWQDQRGGVLDIYGFDLLRDAEVRLTDTPENEALPYLEGYWMVTEEDGAGLGTANFRLTHLEAGVSAPLTNTPTEKAFPGMAAGQFVWLETTDAGREIRTAPLPAMQAVFADHNAIVVTPDLADRFATAFALLEAWQGAAHIGSIGRFTQLLPEVESETATWETDTATGDNFPLVAGEFLWVRFADARLVDLGMRANGPVDLADGVNAVARTDFPTGFHAARLIDQLGTDKVKAVRMLDSRSGQWVAVVVEDGQLLGPDFAIPESALLLVELNQAVTGWLPQ